MDNPSPLPNDGVSSGLKKLEEKTEKDPQDKLEEANLDFARAQTEALRETTLGASTNRQIKVWLVPTVVGASLLTILICLAVTVTAAFGFIKPSSSVLHVIDAGFVAGGFGVIGAILHGIFGK